MKNNFMGILDRFINKDDNSDELEEENALIKKGKKKVENDLEELRDKYNEIMEKYIKLLEDKSISFDKFLYYHDLYSDAYNTIKENKKEMSDYRSEIKSLKDNFIDYCIRVAPYLPTLIKCNNEDKFFLVLETLYYAKLEINIEDLIIICKKLKITKSIILDEYPNIYNDLKIVELNIEE